MARRFYSLAAGWLSPQQASHLFPPLLAHALHPHRGGYDEPFLCQRDSELGILSLTRKGGCGSMNDGMGVEDSCFSASFTYTIIRSLRKLIRSCCAKDF